MPNAKGKFKFYSLEIVEDLNRKCGTQRVILSVGDLLCDKFQTTLSDEKKTRYILLSFMHLCGWRRGFCTTNDTSKAPDEFPLFIKKKLKCLEMSTAMSPRGQHLVRSHQRNEALVAARRKAITPIGILHFVNRVKMK